MAEDKSSPAVLEVGAVSKSYGTLKALDRVNMNLHKGEFVALLGPNGAGKTTLFQLLTGLFVPDDGTIQILGHDIRRSPVRALGGIGVVFQQPTLDLDLSVRANLVYHCRLHGIPRTEAKQRITEELERLNLVERAADPARSLSGGNRRKVEVARALLHNPGLLLMDEATVGLDPGSRASLVDYVVSLCEQRKISVLWSTHLVDEAERAHRVFMLHKGNLIADGTPATLTAKAERNNLAEAFLSMTGVTPGPSDNDQILTVKGSN
ncbi:MAG: ATP-binding cassette domain-containing protein [Deltaproteobacteria bacterium]|nr:ATP-binding cassette domain-containing protein [Deltaproteobacteria bacterium]MBW2476088.1 ATP-binding cassette domain-containing protein [Deltaproteobacteria bacterium]MBW2519710.1 ATP-binding cassette domain-containing protein [Deltaproteobacteria bacterium]